MLTSAPRPLQRLSEFLRGVVRRPLAPADLGLFAVATVVLGTLYCAAYCRLAYRPMHSGTMPLWLSFWWAFTALLPWLLAFETLKRGVPGQVATAGKALLVAGLCAVTALTTFAAERIADAGLMGGMLPDWRMVAANQLQPLLLFLILAALWAGEQARDLHDEIEGEADGAVLPPLVMIDLIRAAGNYVEVQCGTRLHMRRMTMRAAEVATAGGDFVRIHRSVIVRSTLILGFVPGKRDRIELTTGEILSVGDSYRRAVVRFVPPSQTFGTSAHSPS